MKKYILQYLLPGFLFIFVGFIAGNQSNLWLGLFGFLSFFVIGVTLIVEGFKRKRAGKL